MAESRLGYMLMLESGSSNDFEQVRVELHNDELIVRREAGRKSTSRPLKNGTSSSSNKDPVEKERTVLLKRESSGLGISVKGGSENKIPVLISKIYKGQAADKCGQLNIGDIILKVDGRDMRNATHDDVVEALKNGGDCVTLVVKHLKSVTPYLRQAASVGKEESQDSSVTSEIESSDKSPETSSNRSSSSMSEVAAEEITIPLDMASLSQYKTGEDTLRDGFEVVSKDEKVAVTLFSNQPEDLTVWYKAVKNNIIISARQMIRSLNSALSEDEQIVFMNWVWERRYQRGQRQTWFRKMLAIKGTRMLLFDRAPSSVRDWSRHEFAYPLIEIEHNVCKQDDLLDKRRHCFTISDTQKKKHYFAVDTHGDLLDWTTKIINSVRSAVETLKVKIYPGSWKGTRVKLHLDIEEGLKLYTGDDKTLLWNHKFSQLRGSSDDGRTKLTLMLKPETGPVEEIVIDFANIREVMLALLSFYSAKLADIDPAFLKNL
ncbi:gamma-2-syntrophin-like [Dendronephthya gigantea]|uniref:gamma-2-syntrophin-like n=1 Tax=Dendronephthya gigantea TaxID=151771 RepID=UPI00106C8E14|nr:gamma-2-syntrophin-like [Dendronephthya gigantea]